MKACLNCQKEFEHKREAAKYCSDKCRVMYNRRFPKDWVSKTQVQVLYNEMLEMAANLKGVSFKPTIPLSQETQAVMKNLEDKNQMPAVKTYDYNDLKRLIRATTSSYELRDCWEMIEKIDLPGWQRRELEKIKNDQVNIIDF